MSKFKFFGVIGAAALAVTSWGTSARAQEVKKVFVVAMENHNWTQPANQFSGGIQQIFQNPAAPFINSLVNGSATAVINGQVVNISESVAYAANYHNVLATASGNNPHIHPSEPNYLWAEAGSNFGILNDNDPFNDVNTNAGTELPAGTPHLTGLLQAAGISWKSYQEDIDLTPSASGLTNVPLPSADFTVPLVSQAGLFASGSSNAFNGSNQFNYAVKHSGMPFFPDTSGGDNTTPSNPLSHNYAPLQQLFVDLANDNVAEYNWITPDQYNDQHTTLTGGYKGLTGDPAKILQGDDFLRQVIPVIMASHAYQENGVIIIWWDESESDATGDNGDDLNHSIGEIVISKHAHPNVNGLPYASPVFFTHSSDLRTMQEIFHVGPFLGDAANPNTNDLSDLFQPGAIVSASAGQGRN